MDERFEVIVVGAGQQGLALGKKLQEAGRSFLILEAQEKVGMRWEGHYDSLILFTPRRYSALPGLHIPGEQDGYASKDEFGAYLRDYVDYFHLPVVTNARVTRLFQKEKEFILETKENTYQAEKVVIATGYTKPVMPETEFSGFSIHSAMYKNPSQIPGEKVLVVGNGNSASQIALELSSTHEVHIAMREMPRMIPRLVFGKSFYWWGEVLGTNRIASDSFIGKLFRREKDFVVGKELARALKNKILTRKPGFQSASGATVTFDDGSTTNYDTIIFATGFAPDYSWIDIPDAHVHKKGVSKVAGLYFAGLRNQLTGVSSNIYGTHQVSEHIASKF